MSGDREYVGWLESPGGTHYRERLGSIEAAREWCREAAGKGYQLMPGRKSYDCGVNSRGRMLDGSWASWRAEEQFTVRARKPAPRPKPPAKTEPKPVDFRRDELAPGLAWVSFGGERGE